MRSLQLGLIYIFGGKEALTVANIEYKAITIKASPGSGSENARAKFDVDVTAQLNEANAKLGADGWELTSAFSAAVAGLYTFVFKRTV